MRQIPDCTAIYRTAKKLKSTVEPPIRGFSLWGMYLAAYFAALKTSEMEALLLRDISSLQGGQIRIVIDGRKMPQVDLDPVASRVLERYLVGIKELLRRPSDDNHLFPCDWFGNRYNTRTRQHHLRQALSGDPTLDNARHAGILRYWKHFTSGPGAFYEKRIQRMSDFCGLGQKSIENIIPPLLLNRPERHPPIFRR